MTLVWPFKVTGGQCESSRLKVIYDFLSVTNSKAVAYMHCFQVTVLWKFCDLGLTFQGHWTWLEVIYDFLSVTNSKGVAKMQHFESPVTLVWPFKVTWHKGKRSFQGQTHKRHTYILGQNSTANLKIVNHIVFLYQEAKTFSVKVHRAKVKGHGKAQRAKVIPRSNTQKAHLYLRTEFHSKFEDCKPHSFPVSGSENIFSPSP